MFHAPMGKFQLELIEITFFTVVPFNSCALSCRSFVLNSNCQLPKPGDTRNFNTEKYRVENVVITTKSLQERTQPLNGTTVKKDNSNLILLQCWQ